MRKENRINVPIFLYILTIMGFILLIIGFLSLEFDSPWYIELIGDVGFFLFIISLMIIVVILIKGYINLQEIPNNQHNDSNKE